MYLLLGGHVAGFSLEPSDRRVPATNLLGHVSSSAEAALRLEGSLALDRCLSLSVGMAAWRLEHQGLRVPRPRLRQRRTAVEAVEAYLRV